MAIQSKNTKESTPQNTLTSTLFNKLVDFLFQYFIQIYANPILLTLLILNLVYLYYPVLLVVMSLVIIEINSTLQSQNWSVYQILAYVINHWVNFQTNTSKFNKIFIHLTTMMLSFYISFKMFLLIFIDVLVLIQLNYDQFQNFYSMLRNYGKTSGISRVSNFSVDVNQIMNSTTEVVDSKNILVTSDLDLEIPSLESTNEGNSFNNSWTKDASSSEEDPNNEKENHAPNQKPTRRTSSLAIGKLSSAKLKSYSSKHLNLIGLEPKRRTFSLKTVNSLHKNNSTGGKPKERRRFTQPLPVASSLDSTTSDTDYHPKTEDSDVISSISQDELPNLIGSTTSDTDHEHMYQFHDGTVVHDHKINLHHKDSKGRGHSKLRKQNSLNSSGRTSVSSGFITSGSTFSINKRTYNSELNLSSIHENNNHQSSSGLSKTQPPHKNSKKKSSKNSPEKVKYKGSYYVKVDDKQFKKMKNLSIYDQVGL